jgi:hypothetical protein
MDTETGLQRTLLCATESERYYRIAQETDAFYLHIRHIPENRSHAWAAWNERDQGREEGFMGSGHLPESLTFDQVAERAGTRVLMLRLSRDENLEALPVGSSTTVA